MANTYTLIASNTFSSSAASVTFSSIPNTYTDLVLRISARSDRSSSVDTYAYLELNSATSYSYTQIEGNGSSAISQRATSANHIVVGFMSASTATSNTFGTAEVYIPSYTASQNKPVGAFGAAETNATSVGMTAVAGLWQSTAAITSIRIWQPGTGQWVSGSSFFLYGIKAN